MLLSALFILLVCAVVFGGWGYTRNMGYYGWSPTGLLILLIIVVLLTGGLGPIR